MALHVSDECAVSGHEPSGSHCNGEGHVQGVVRRMIDGEADVESDLVQIELARGRWGHLSSDQRQSLPCLI